MRAAATRAVDLALGRSCVLIDARRVPNDAVVDADVCVVGSGPAGLTLARELAARHMRVCVLESGGFERDASTQALADGRFSGANEFEPLRNTRRRQVGGGASEGETEVGTAARPVFRAGPLDSTDFERRSWLPHSGWPFGRAHLDPYYERARTSLGLGPFGDTAGRGEVDGARRLPLDPATFTAAVRTFVRREVFTDELPRALAAAPTVSFYLWANVIEVEVDEDARNVTSLRVACLSGTSFRVTARCFVLAAGGLENARLLLLSDRVQRGGLGNGHNVVGRYFMEHQSIRGGTLFPARHAPADRSHPFADDVRHAGGVAAVGDVALREDVRRREQLLGLGAALLPGRRGREARPRYPNAIAAALRAAAGLRLARRALAVDVRLHVEQAPHPENRVMLDDARDALGCRKTHLHWLWRARDVDSVLRAQQILVDGIRRAGLGEYRPALANGRPVLEAAGLRHHMGTTRMHADPKQGVVDANCRVHGVSNLFIAGCSVFPTGGYVDPTLTVLALSLRLAEHVQGALAGSPVVLDTAMAGR